MAERGSGQMSGIYIPNMEMPGISEGIFIYHKDSFAVLAKVDGNGHVLKTISYSQAIPVPDHGRLADMDAIARRYEYELSRTFVDDYAKGFQTALKAVLGEATHIVIPADKEDACKTGNM